MRRYETRWLRARPKAQATGGGCSQAPTLLSQANPDRRTRLFGFQPVNGRSQTGSKNSKACFHRPANRKHIKIRAMFGHFSGRNRRINRRINRRGSGAEHIGKTRAPQPITAMLKLAVPWSRRIRKVLLQAASICVQHYQKAPHQLFELAAQLVVDCIPLIERRICCIRHLSFRPPHPDYPVR